MCHQEATVKLYKLWLFQKVWIVCQIYQDYVFYIWSGFAWSWTFIRCSSSEPLNIREWLTEVWSGRNSFVPTGHNSSTQPVQTGQNWELWIKSGKTKCVASSSGLMRLLPQVEEPYDPERCFYYPLQLDLDLERDLGDEEDFDVDDCKTPSDL